MYPNFAIFKQQCAWIAREDLEMDISYCVIYEKVLLKVLVISKISVAQKKHLLTIHKKNFLSSLSLYATDKINLTTTKIILIN